jgi:hypothetical protein
VDKETLYTPCICYCLRLTVADSTLLPALFDSTFKGTYFFAKQADSEQLSYENWHLESAFVVHTVPQVSHYTGTRILSQNPIKSQTQTQQYLPSTETLLRLH